MPRALSTGQSSQLYVHDLASGRARLRYSSPDILFEAPNWSPDGRELVVNADGRLWRLGADDGDLVEVPMPGVEYINNDHVLSPDGATAYVSSEDGHIYAVPFRGEGGIRCITTDKGPSFRHYLHGVSPDGATLAYIGMEILSAGGTRTNVYLLDLATQQERQLTDDDFPDDGAEFSPDGEWVYFNSERGGGERGHAQLFRVPTAGGEPEQLTFDERVNWFPHISPDGRRIAYVSFPPGTIGHPENRDVIVRLREADGTTADVMAFLGGQGTINVPSWAPDGSAFAFVAYPVAG
ncbi:MAG: biopolymer transporter Tol [Microbacteriaceae bacterium]|nr:biopolymer transporter Tol [Microbacteriaceae bacterium]MCL2793797.1 biopolymer transporter Tol [Microbacteriaceae bacterium]